MNSQISALDGRMSAPEIQERVRQLGDWFHNLDLRGVKTAPEHFLGDYPQVKWQQFCHAIPEDMSGRSVLDIGCNAGFYSLEMKRRGADRVVAIDFDEHYLAQARFAAEVREMEIEFRKMSVYDVAQLREKFDVVFFMGVLYHLRHPLLALDLIHEHVTADLLIFQSMQRGTPGVEPLEDNYHFWETELFNEPRFPRLHFVEKKYADDITNWWIPNQACAEAMLRSAGFELISHPEQEVYVCRARPGLVENGAVYPAKA